MELLEAYKLGQAQVNIPFVTYFLEGWNIRFDRNSKGNVVDKGSSGKIFERAIGLPPTTTLKDFTDGEAKTFGVKKNKPQDSMAVTMLGHTIDCIMDNVPWEETKVYDKTKTLLLIPTVKDSTEPEDWYFDSPFIVNAEKYPEAYKKIEEDFKYVSKVVRDTVNAGGLIHSTAGPNKYLQIRTGGGSNPNHYKGKNISKAGYRWYLMMNFLREVYE